MTRLGRTPFEQIDDLVCGADLVPDRARDRARACQSAIGVDEPLSRRVASRLIERPGARIALYTGFVAPKTYPGGENDGPLGTAALARALRRLGARPTVYTDPEVAETTRWLLAELGAGVPVSPLDGGSDALPESVDVAIAIEKPGGNPAGIMHTCDGARIEGGSTSIDRMFAAFGRAGALTVGVGDLGNEVGFGRLREQIYALDPWMRTCACGCGAGIVAAVATDLLFPAVVSNWGAYGLAAAIALLAETSDCALLPEEERRMLHVAAVRGCCDGVRRRAGYKIDGFDGETSVRIVRRLRELVRLTLEARE